MTKILTNKSSTNIDYPICRPSLDLDFTQERLDPRITFTRGSIGTRVNRNRLIETVSANQPRFDYDPVTGECKGLLIEESRTNLFLYSDSPNLAYYDPAMTAFSVNSIISPDGTQNADKVLALSGKSFAQISQGVTITSGATVTSSVYIKYGGFDRVEIVMLSNNNTTPYARATFNPILGTITTAVSTANGGTNASANIVSVGNGWYRCNVTVTYPAVTLAGIRINATSSSSGISEGTLGVYVWGMQIEQGAFPTSYIPTSASTVTRSADVASITGTNFSSWYNSSEGTLYSAWSIPVTPSGFPGIANLQDSGRQNGVVISTNSSRNNRVTIRGSNLTIIDDYTNLTLPLNSVAKSAIAYITNSLNTNSFYSGNGTNENTKSVNKNIPITGVDRLILGNNVGNILTGHIRRVTYYPKALKPLQLQLLTQ